MQNYWQKNLFFLTWTAACILLALFVSSAAYAQTTAFTYQGKLNISGTPANGTYEMQFQLFDAPKGGAQVGSTVTDSNVAVVNGVFTTTLDFGAAALATGSDRYLEISVRLSGSGDPFTLLSPLQQFKSAPYSIQSKNAAAADALSPNCVNCVTSAQIQSVDGAQITGVLPTVTIPSGSDNYIQNASVPRTGKILGQPAASLNIGGTATVGSMDVNGPVSITGTAEPAPAPAGQGRIYFDAASNKVKVSENNGAFIDLVGASGVSGSGTVDSIPFWSGGKILGNSQITQSAAGVQLPTNVQLAPGAQGNQVQFGTPNSETGMTISGPTGRADIRFDGTNLRMFAGPAGVPPSIGVTVNSSGVSLPSGVSLAATASGNNVAFGSPNSETGMTISGASGRADIRYNGSLKLLNGPGGIPPVGNGIEINQAGNVSVGNYSGSVAKLMVGSSVGIAISGANNSSGIGVIGQSTSGTGVFGEGGGTGVFARSWNVDGTALYVDGNARQSLNNGGLIKAMALIRVVRSTFPDPPMATASVLRCYNSQNNTSSGNCGITFGTVFTTTGVQINFGFVVFERFVSLTGNSGGNPSISSYPNPTTVEVLDGLGTQEFFIFIY